MGKIKLVGYDKFKLARAIATNVYLRLHFSVGQIQQDICPRPTFWASRGLVGVEVKIEFFCRFGHG